MRLAFAYYLKTVLKSTALWHKLLFIMLYPKIYFSGVGSRKKDTGDLSLTR